MSLLSVPGQTDSIPRLLQHCGETGLKAHRIETVSENYGVSK